jgi:hypothetical protein
MYLRHSTYTRVYLSPDPLNLYSFSSNQMDQKLDQEAGDFKVYYNIINPPEMAAEFEEILRLGTVTRNTKYYEPFLRNALHEKENESIWY